MGLERLYAEEWASLEEEWRAQCAEFGEEFDDYASQYVSHARSVAFETPPHRDYGVYAFRGAGGGRSAIMHANRALLPRTMGATLRIVWVLLAPRFDYVDWEIAEMAEISAGVISSSIELARSDKMPSQHLKIHMGSAFDRALFAAVIAAMRPVTGLDISLRGNWVHLDSVGLP